MVLACCHVHVCIGIGQIHWKTQCFRSVHAPRSSASTTFIGKGTGCREWWWFLQQCVEGFLVKSAEASGLEACRGLFLSFLES